MDPQAWNLAFRLDAIHFFLGVIPRAVSPSELKTEAKKVFEVCMLVHQDRYGGCTENWGTSEFLLIRAFVFDHLHKVDVSLAPAGLADLTGDLLRGIGDILNGKDHLAGTKRRLGVIDREMTEDEEILIIRASAVLQTNAGRPIWTCADYIFDRPIRLP